MATDVRLPTHKIVAAGIAFAQPASFDVVIRGGKVVDGTGAPASVPDSSPLKEGTK